MSLSAYRTYEVHVEVDIDASSGDQRTADDVRRLIWRALRRLDAPGVIISIPLVRQVQP